MENYFFHFHVDIKYRISSKYGTPSNYGNPLFSELQNVQLHKTDVLSVGIFFIYMNSLGQIN